MVKLLTVLCGKLLALLAQSHAYLCHDAVLRALTLLLPLNYFHLVVLPQREVDVVRLVRCDRSFRRVLRLIRLQCFGSRAYDS